MLASLTAIADRWRSVSANAAIRPTTFLHPDVFTPRLVLSDLDNITRELSAGRSVAIATGFMSAVVLSQLDPIGAAKHALDRSEQLFWSKFQTDPHSARSRFPTIDWATSKVEIATSDRSRKRFIRRAHALNIIYGTTVVDCANAKWFTLHHQLYLPFVKAVDRMQAAERITARSPQETYAAMIKIETACLKSVAGAAADALVARVTEFEASVGVVIKGVDALQGRGKEVEKYFDAHIAASGEVPYHPIYNTNELRTVEGIIQDFSNWLTRHAEEMTDSMESEVAAIMAIWDRIVELESE